MPNPLNAVFHELVMATVAILTGRLPILPDEPGSPRLFALTREWAKKHRLHLFCLCPIQDPRHELTSLFETIEFLPCPPPKSTLTGRIKHRLTNAPFFVHKYRNPKHLAEVRLRLEELIRKHSVTHLHVNQITNTEYLPSSTPPFQTTIDVRDAHSLIFSREAALTKSLFRKAELLLEARSFGVYAQKLVKKGYPLIVVADEDHDHLLKVWNVPTRVIPNGIDTEYFKEQPHAVRKPYVLFTGVMNYAPNIETALHFANDIFPLIKQLSPQVEFYVVGADPAPEILLLNETQGIRVTGTVPDIRPYLSEASAFVCPMRSGAGIKNKILAAMAMRLPVVATALGIAGVAAEPERHCFIRETPSEFAKLTAKLVSGEINTEAMTKEAKDFVELNYVWKSIAEEIARGFSDNPIIIPTNPQV